MNVFFFFYKNNERYFYIKMLGEGHKYSVGKVRNHRVGKEITVQGNKQFIPL